MSETTIPRQTHRTTETPRGINIPEVIRESAERSHQPFTPEEMDEIWRLHRRRTVAPVVAAVVHRLAFPDSGAQDIGHYLERQQTQTTLSAIPANPSKVTTEQKARMRASRDKLKKEISGHSKPAYRFEGTLTAVTAYESRFDEQFIGEDGNYNRATLATLYDETDHIRHPALSLLPDATTLKPDNPRRDLIVEADRLLRFMVYETLQNQVQIQ